MALGGGGQWCGERGGVGAKGASERWLGQHGGIARGEAISDELASGSAESGHGGHVSELLLRAKEGERQPSLGE
ncbi:hypothetical protein NL676_038980 [Syzygium grande]|nr:hypothetical protein NL676_038980 [Syzygium grande]